MAPPLSGILETALYADDLEAAKAFYAQVLGLEVIVHDPDRHVFFRCGTGVLLVFRPAVTASEQTQINGAPIPLHGCQGAGHMCFREPAERLAAWRRHLTDHGVAIESDVVWPNGAKSLYFRDPAGNSLEIATPDLWGFPA